MSDVVERLRDRNHGSKTELEARAGHAKSPKMKKHRAPKTFGASTMRGAEVQRALEDLGWTLRYAGEVCGLTPESFSLYVNDHKRPRRDTAALLRTYVAIKRGKPVEIP